MLLNHEQPNRKHELSRLRAPWFPDEEVPASLFVVVPCNLPPAFPDGPYRSLKCL